ncbi:hypothetical protein GDO81_003525 [Engystomops pustulosus]|uniref:Uncharacterized protein n=1 Tax=Engystomops pustulosus TaxID=76066 RepID=A0AAV6ZWM5_ENGPU|nr:hypothetical protein GDO81_003525 [Engystomops pustulosus]
MYPTMSVNNSILVSSLSLVYISNTKLIRYMESFQSFPMKASAFVYNITSSQNWSMAWCRHCTSYMLAIKKAFQEVFSVPCLPTLVGGGDHVM